ncbi:MAG: Fe-S oxidoreductase, partial [Myxococcaceae bacterium]|nr:Fe-S oxidoreductase [Myxococcaceae bacterium]
MDCDLCNDLLLDLHYDELDPARAAEVRAHLEGCDACRAASARLTRTRSLVAGLALPDAPPHSAAVMAALASTAPVTAAVSGRVSAVIPIERAREAKATGWLQRVGELAMRRQVAMVAISLLMVGLGLRYLPFRSPTQSVTTEMTQPEVIPATELTPAAPVVAAQAPTQPPATTMRSRTQSARPTAQAPEGRVAARPSSVDSLRAAAAS